MRTLLFALTLVACKRDVPTPQDTDCLETGFADRDGDGFGDAARPSTACVEPIVADSTDCDDGDFFANPGEDEACDGFDNDCDGLIDQDDPDLVITPVYLDQDGDDYGAGAPIQVCDPPANTVAADGDCDDTNPDLNPGIVEICDTLDNDCDDLIDDEDPSTDGATEWFLDQDFDGFAGELTVVACDEPANADFFASDCDDADGTAFPGAEERCNNADDDCDGGIDGPPFTPPVCAGYDGTWAGTYQATFDDGTTLRTCTGTASVVIDRTADPALQGTFTCDLDAAQGSWALTQTGPITGTVWRDGTLEGSIAALEGVDQPWLGVIDPLIDVNGSGAGFLVSGGAWDLEYAFTLTEQFP